MRIWLNVLSLFAILILVTACSGSSANGYSATVTPARNKDCIVVTGTPNSNGIYCLAVIEVAK